MNLGTLGASLVPLGPPELTARPRVWQVSMYVIMYVDRCSLHKPGADELARPRSRSSEQAPWIASWNLLQPSPQSCIPAPMHHPARAPTAPNCDCNLRVCLCCPVASEPKLCLSLSLSSALPPVSATAGCAAPVRPGINRQPSIKDRSPQHPSPRPVPLALST